MFVRTFFRGPKIGSLCRVLLRLELYFEIAKFMSIYMQLFQQNLVTVHDQSQENYFYFHECRP